MQLHHLTLSAIGPFAGEHSIDFAALSASGLFLLEGPTGSGKSTIIDAVVYALYGKVASEAASDDRVRSAYADEKTPSFVDLIFETNSGIYRVVRQPEWMRAKQRGEGLTKENASATLWRLTPADLDAIQTCLAAGGTHNDVSDLALGQLRSTRLDEIGAEITRALGLDRAQFVQTVVLPQGEFANFLRSDPSERSALLQKVFGTEIYKRAQEALADLKKEALRTVDEHVATRRDALRAFVQAASDNKTEPSLDLQELEQATDDDLLTAVADQLDRIVENQQATSTKAKAAQSAEAIARKRYEDAKVTAERWDRREKLRARRALLDSKKPDITAQTQRIDLARRATNVSPLITGLEQAHAAFDVALKHAVTAVSDAQGFAELPAVSGDFAPSIQANATEQRSTAALFERAFSESREDLVHQRDTAQTQVGALQALAELEAGLPAREAEHSQQIDRLEQLRTRRVDLAAQLEARPAAQQKLENHRDSLRELAQRVPLETKRVEEAEKLVAAFGALDKARTDEHIAAQAQAKAAEKAHELSVIESQARAAWLGQMSGRLAQDLREGEPCAVCGSREHPAPALVDDRVATQDDVTAAEAQRKAAEQQVTAAVKAHAAATERLTAAEQAVAGKDMDSASGELNSARTALADALSAAKHLPQAETAVTDFAAETQKLRDHDGTLATEISALAATNTQVGQKLEGDRALIAQALAHRPAGAEHSGESQFSSVAALQNWYDTSARTLTQLLAAIDALRTHRNAVTERETQVRAALAEQEFADIASAQAAQLPAEALRTLEKSVQDFHAEWAAVQDQLLAEEFVLLPEDLNVDVTALAHELEQAESALQAALVELATLDSTFEQARIRSQSLTEAAAALNEVRAKVAPTVRMAEIAAGTSADNQKRQTLAVYVLTRRFEDVVSAANSRLTVMSDGRYELERSEEKEDVRTRRVGLALRVIDHHTETSRDPRTLSGGETFYVSLCLALGLADVVTAEAGGVELGTLFVDEGFGSLDPETLESVLKVLGELRDGGRAVGVVSHVETLKQAIGDGISVRHQANGGSTLTVRV